MKRLLRLGPAQAVVAWLAAQYIRLTFRTIRWTEIGRQRIASSLEGKPFIGCFWHGRMLMVANFWTFTTPMHILISEHQDGRLISRTIEHFGVRTITGSSSRGGAAALRIMAQTLARGECVAVTPDGPRGPRMRAAPGIAMAARLAGVPIVPASYSCTSAISLSSWDRFLLALPFGRGVFIWGEPVTVEPGDDMGAVETARAQVEMQLNQLTQEADRLCGRKPVEPAPDTTRLATDPA